MSQSYEIYFDSVTSSADNIIVAIYSEREKQPPIFTFTDLPHHRTCSSAYGGFVLSHLAMCGKLFFSYPYE